MMTPPHSTLEPVTDVFHGVPVTDPYRWLEDQDSPRTRAWIQEQTRYARAYLDSIPERERIRERIREFLAVETYDSLQKAGSRYFIRKRLPDQELPCIYMREGADREDHLLIGPSKKGSGNYTAVKSSRVSPDGRLLLYEAKKGRREGGHLSCSNLRLGSVSRISSPAGICANLVSRWMARASAVLMTQWIRRERTIQGETASHD